MSWWFWVFIILSMLVAIGSSGNTQAGKALAVRFNALGNLIGKTKEEIIAAVGPPNLITAMPTLGHGKVHLSWYESDYHIILIFNNDICEGIAMEQHSFK